MQESKVFYGVIIAVVIVALAIGLWCWYSYYYGQEEQASSSGKSLRSLRSTKSMYQDAPYDVRLYMIQLITKFCSGEDLPEALKEKWMKGYLSYFSGDEEKASRAVEITMEKFNNIYSLDQGLISQEDLLEESNSLNEEFGLLLSSSGDGKYKDRIVEELNDNSRIAISEYNELKSVECVASEAASQAYKESTARLFNLLVKQYMSV